MYKNFQICLFATFLFLSKSQPEDKATKSSKQETRSIQQEDASDVEVLIPKKEKQYDPYDPYNQNGYNNGYNPDYNNGYDPNYNNGNNPNYNNGYNPGYDNGLDPTYTGSGNDLEAFTARRAADVEVIPGRKVMFRDTVSQLGTGWKNYTSEFVCDTAGYFFFTFSICGERYRHFRVSLMKNGFGIVSAYGEQNGYQMASNSAVLFLLPNDRVYLQLAEGGIFEVRTLTGRAYNTFTGFRIL